MDTYVADSPLYRSSPTERRHDLDALYRRVTQTGRQAGYLLLDCLEDRSELSESQLSPFVRRAEERADEGLPISEFLDAHLRIIDVVQQTLLEQLHPVAPGLVAAALAHLRSEGRRLVRAVGTAYQREYVTVHARDAETATDVALGLVHGRPVEETAERVGVRLAASYVTLAVAIGDTPAEVRADDLGRRIGTRRKLRHATELLHGGLGEHVLVAMTDSRGHVLLPVTSQGPAPGELEETLDRLADALGTTVIASWEDACARTDLPAASRRADRLLDVALPTREHGLVRRSDHLLELQLTVSTEASGPLRTMLDSVAREHGLLETLRVFVDQDLNRTRTARTLGVHPNTVDNRLTRVEALTGLDVRTSRGLMLVGAALLTRDADAGRARRG
ncbi:transcriptional regulator [Marmoricola endophyticus]|uniref:Transcriptional regulator n=1 Tax=Marmoricola endophyticus TaxID=2040280 RepID=A0A917BFL4_9ACTN|nr:transcriptional regulator [Marmoricola endophyticus]